MTCRSETINDECVWEEWQLWEEVHQCGPLYDGPPPPPVTQYDDEGREIVAEVMGVDDRGRDVWVNTRNGIAELREVA